MRDDEFGDRTPQRLGAAEAEDLLGASVELDDAALVVDRDDRVGVIDRVVQGITAIGLSMNFRLSLHARRRSPAFGGSTLDYSYRFGCPEIGRANRKSRTPDGPAAERREHCRHRCR